MCEHYRARRWIGELLNILSDINQIKIKTWGKSVSLPEHSRSHGLSASGYLVSCWNLAWENFISSLNVFCLLKEASYWPVGVKRVLYASSKAARFSGLVPEQAKKNLLVANPLELTPSPLDLCRNLQSILLSFLTWDLLYHDIKLQLWPLQAAFYDSLQCGLFLHLTGLQFCNWVGKCT